MSKIKQKLLAKKISENIRKPMGKAMMEVGYSKSYSEKPQLLEKTKTWEDLMEKHFPDTKLTKVIEEGLEATRVISAVKGTSANGGTTDFIDVPDYMARHKFVETSLKLKSKFPNEKLELMGKNGKAFVVEFHESLKQK